MYVVLCIERKAKGWFMSSSTAADAFPAIQVSRDSPMLPSSPPSIFLPESLWLYAIIKFHVFIKTSDVQHVNLLSYVVMPVWISCSLIWGCPWDVELEPLMIWIHLLTSVCLWMSMPEKLNWYNAFFYLLHVRYSFDGDHKPKAKINFFYFIWFLLYWLVSNWCN